MFEGLYDFPHRVGWHGSYALRCGLAAILSYSLLFLGIDVLTAC